MSGYASYAKPIVFSGTAYQKMYSEESKKRDLSKDPNYFNPNVSMQDLAATALHYASNKNWGMTYQVLIEMASQDPKSLEQLLPPAMLATTLSRIGLDQKIFDSAVRANKST